MTDTPERFREVEPLALPDWTAHAARVVKGIFQIGAIYWTVPEARAASGSTSSDAGSISQA